MKLTHGLHLAYCTNVHRGNDWAETLGNLERHTLAVRRAVCPDHPYAIGLRLSATAARELAQPETLRQFQRWLASHRCYIFTINGFPYGSFHGVRVKEQVAQPDWTQPERLAYTNLLFDLLAELLPVGVEGSVSTVPVSFKQFKLGQRGVAIAREHLWRCVEHQEQLTRRTGKKFHLGLEPEPFGTVENTAEFLTLFEQLETDRPGDMRLQEHLGINYDTCHFALQYESPAEALGRLRRRGVRISKLHLSNALRVHPTREVRAALRAFDDGVYFHQVVERRPDGEVVRYADLDEALVTGESDGPQFDREWRVHFHVPLHTPETQELGTTVDHLRGALDVVKQNPRLCSHLEMETYTWEVLPRELKQPRVEDMLISEYRWLLSELAQRGIVAV
ncbi:MAG TPA: metabolite traffic protein EboE [Verrucomicrobiota bacterium]|nr:metabolite traffic protein EboE [Verrucomicrobiota bacterium]